MRNFTIFKTGSQRGVNTFMSGEGAIEHPMSTHSAPIGTSWTARGWRYIASILMILTLCVGNAWADIDWTNYAVGYTRLTDGGKYYIWNHTNPAQGVTTDLMLSAPSSYPKSTAKNAAWSKNASTNYDAATLFTFAAQAEANQWKISYQEGNATKYLTQKAGTGGSSAPTGWNTNQEVWEIKDYTHTDSKTYYTNGTLVNTAKTSNKALYFTTSSAISWRNLGINTNNAGGYNSYAALEWQFISEAAYEDATAGTTTTAKTFAGAQYYYTANANATAGGTAVVATTSYKKPSQSDLKNSDYAATISGQKGKYEGTPTVTFYYKATANSGYHFVGWFAAAEGGSVLSENLEYTYSFTATSTSSGSPTPMNLYARFEQNAAAAVVYTGGTGEPTPYATLSAALTAANNGDLIVLQGNVGETTMISKNITLDFNGYKIQGSANNLVTVAGTVSFVDNSLGTPGGVTTTGATAVLVSGGSLTINDGKYKAATYAVEHIGGSVTIKNGGFESDATQDINGTITLNGGFFRNNGNLTVSNEYAVTPHIPTGMKYSAKDYRYMIVKKNSANYPVCTVISKNVGVDTLKINFNSLEAAIAYANNNADDDRDKTILLHENYPLSAGNYTIPARVILSVPYSADQDDAMPNLRRVMEAAEPTSAYCTLTLASGVHIDVFGEMEVGGRQMTGDEKAVAIARPAGPTYGLLQMNSGSSITLYEDANFYAWGFVQGEGTIDVRRGAVVKEQFQINDWKLLAPTAKMAMGTSVDYQLHVLPVNQYFIQNVEVRTTYRPGSRLLAQVAATVPQLVNNSTVLIPLAFNDVGIIGVRYSDEAKAANPDLQDDVAIFLLDNEADQENTWVRKSYDIANDVQLYEVNNSAYLGSLAMKVTFTEPITAMGMTIKGLDVDSRDFVLPIASNFKIHLLNGTLVATQNTVLLPGSEIKINKKATMTITDQVWKKVQGEYKWVTDPQTLYVYDKDQWGTYVSGESSGDVLVMGYGSRIKYRHGGVPTARTLTPAGLGDAKLTVHGTVDVRGYLKSTTGDKTCTPILPYKKVTIGNEDCDRVDGKSIVDCDPQTDGGGAITSTVTDAGTIIFSREAQAESATQVEDYLWQVNYVNKSTSEMVRYFGNHAIPALLTNETGSAFSEGDGYTETAGTEAGQSFCFIDIDKDGKGEWVSLEEDGCFVYDGEYYYAKPKDYVKLLHGKTEEDNHTYKSADGSRTFILVDDCQWWEVVPVAGHPDLFKCEHPDNRIYYYYDYEASKWKEKRYTVKWNDWNGSTFATYTLKYGVKPEFLGNVPKRDGNEYYTYDFIGWSPAITDQTIVTGDVTYTAQYERKDVMYTVTWKDLAGNIIESGYYKLGDAPTCTSEVNMDGKEWNPAVGAVTGNTIYQLTTKNTGGPFTIKFVNWNWDGTDEHALKIQSVAKTTAPTPPAAPEKAALADVAFEFAGWRAADNQVYASNAIPAATANAIYTATFTEKPITYTITWKNGETALDEQEVTPNTVPQYTGSTPTNGDEDYAFIGWTPTVVAATADAEYTAVFERRSRTVTNADPYVIPASTQQSLTTVTIADDGKLEIPATSTLTVDNLILEATSNASGQLDASKNSSIVTVNAYFDWKPNGETGTASRTWYAIAVPWEVNAETGIFLKETGRHLVIGQDFDLIYYSGSERASQGNKPSCWKYVQNQSDKIMHPGQLYMMYFDPGFKTIRFAKKTGSAVLYTDPVSVSLFPESTDNMDKDANWNGIANPKTYYASLSAGTATYAQVLNNGNLDDYFADPGVVYQTINLASSKFTVGKPLFVQATEATSVVVTKQTTAGIVNAAPRRAAAAELPKGIDAVYRLAIAGEDQPEADNLFVQVAEDEKADRYTIGQDLVKGGVASGRAQVWVNRYDAKLSVNTQALSEDEATYPLTIQIPSNGEYTLSIGANENEEYALYLTRDGEAIWNLSDGAYTANLEKGAHTNYGLRVSARAPQITTGIDEAVVDAKGETRKVLINNTVYIIRGEHIYSADGQLVK